MVVPPAAAERVPEVKSSAQTVPSIDGWSRWQCPSTPPGVTVEPLASMTRSAPSRDSASETTRPSFMPMSQCMTSAAVATRPPLTIRSNWLMASLPYSRPASLGRKRPISGTKVTRIKIKVIISQGQKMRLDTWMMLRSATLEATNSVMP